MERSAGGPWTVREGPALPQGARFAATTRPQPTGRGVAWCDEGYAYAWDLVGSVRVLGRGSALHVRDGRLAPGPGPVPEMPTAAPPPEDATGGSARVAGLRAVAHRVDGDRVCGWLRDGTVVVASR